jgi:Alginate export
MIFLPLVFLPSLQPYLDLRERFERHINPTFNGKADANRSNLYSRWRIGTTAKLTTNLSGAVEYQYSTDLGWAASGNGVSHNSDISLAYLKWHDSDDGTAIVGRQKLAIGDERLIGPSEWLNVPRSFDAAYVASKNLDIWFGKVSVVQPTPEYARVGAATLTSFAGTSSFIYKHDLTTSENSDLGTLDHFYKHQYCLLNVDVEGAYQVGHKLQKDLTAAAVHAEVGYKVTPKLRFYGIGNYATGGSGPTGTHTFDSLYPSGHDQYDLLDLQGWSNMQMATLGAEYKPLLNTTVKAAWHNMWLANEKDAWYAAGGASNKYSATGVLRDPTGVSGRNVGQELDLEAWWTPRKAYSFGAGVAYFLPGSFVQKASGHSDKETWFFVSAQAKF